MLSKTESTKYDIDNESFGININVLEVDNNFRIIVKPNTTISSLISKLISKLNMKFEWNDYGLYDETNKCWLLPTFTSISEYDINSETKILFIKRFRYMYVQLPDLQVRQIYLDISKSIYDIVENICKKLGIRHHEELSLQIRYIVFDSEHNQLLNKIRRFKAKSKLTNSTSKLIRHKSTSQQSMLKSNSSLKPKLSVLNENSLNRFKSKKTFLRTFSVQCNNTKNHPQSLRYSIEQSLTEDLDFESFETLRLSNSPDKSYLFAENDGDIITIKNHEDKCKSYDWLIVNKSLLNGQINLNDIDSTLLLLRYKYHNYYRLNERFDEVRINQIYQQNKWSFLSGFSNCDDDEAYILGGLILHINRTATTEKDLMTFTSKENLNDEIDNMLDKLSLELLGKCNDDDDDDENDDENEKNQIILNGTIKLIKYPRNIFNRYHLYWAELSNDGIELYTNSKRKLIEIISIKGNNIIYRIKNVNKEIFLIDIYLVKHNIYEEIFSDELKQYERIRLRFYNDEEFIKWVTGLKLLSQGIDYSNIINFRLEYHIISNIINMKRKPLINEINLSKDDENMNLDNIIGPKFNKTFKRKYILKNILLYRDSFEHYTNIEAKMAFIKCWITCRNAVMKYYKIRIFGYNDYCTIGIGYEKIELMDINGNLWKIWELKHLMSWNTNWKTNKTILEFANCKIQLEFLTMKECCEFHEYIGGYLFVMMRNSEKQTDLTKHVFIKMTSIDYD